MLGAVLALACLSRIDIDILQKSTAIFLLCGLSCNLVKSDVLILSLLRGVDGLVAELVGIGIDILVLGPAPVPRLGLQLLPMRPESMRHQLLVPVVARIAAFVLALVHLLLCVPPVMLPPIATRIEALVAEVALKGLLAGVHSLVHLVVRLRVKSFAADLFNS